jgi:hypothetical protein
VVDTQTGNELQRSEREWFRTIDQLFDAIRDASAKPGMLREVNYNSQYGYPTLVSLDPLPNAVDDEVAFRTTLTFEK